MDRLTVANQLIRRAIPGTFNGLFLAELLLFGLATVLFLFYFNRVFGLLVSFLVNAYTWTFYKVTFRVQAIQVSPLGGRVFFKGVCYQGRNETILVHDGYITWRYWLRRVRGVGALRAEGLGNAKNQTEGTALEQETSPPSGEQHDTKSPLPSLPCRIKVKIRGLEWFVYNRSPAYDSVLSTLIDPSFDANGETTLPAESRANEKAPFHINSPDGDASQETSSSPTPTANGRDEVPNTSASMPAFLQSLPIRICGSRAAMVMGNNHTRSVLVAKVREFDGRIDAQPAGPYDKYRQSFDFDIKQGTISFKHNHDYTGSNVEEGSKLWNDRSAVHATPSRGSRLKALFSPIERGLYVLSLLNPLSRKSRTSLAPNTHRSTHTAPTESLELLEASQSRWLGLSRYLVDDNEGELAFERWRAIEYARVETIADLRSLTLSFFWDVPGLANSHNIALSHDVDSLARDHVNGTKAPAYGLDINLGGGTINYGPWADRQRANLQAVFFPSTYARAKAARRLQPGAWRISTVFEIRFVLDEAVVLRIHTREESKDWRWKDQPHDRQPATKSRQKKAATQRQDAEKAVSDPIIRPAGWLEVTITKDSSVVYLMDMLARNEGYRNQLNLDIKAPRISTSVNHDLLCRATALEVKCDLSNPRLWKAVHSWMFDIRTHDLELFFLRDHAFLLQDLVNDWTSGPPNDFFEFVPFLYALKLHLPGTKVYLNVNDSNIINNPSSLDDNTFLIIGADRLDVSLDIPITNYQAQQSHVDFEGDAHQMSLELSTPLWATQRTFLDDKQMADLEHLSLRGSYNYFSATSATLTDTVLLNLEGTSPRLTLFGFLVRYFMNFKENYFGDDLHFQTQEEFQKKLELVNQGQVPVGEVRKNPRPTNDLDVILSVVANEATVALPSLLYSAAEHIKIDTPLASLDLRFTNYYMDMQADFSPLSIAKSSLFHSDGQPMKEVSSVQLFIDGANIVGHRLFGLPPTEPTYVCNWDFDVGHIVGEASVNFLSNLIGSIESFAFGFPDKENSISRLNPPIIRDVVFLRARIQPIKLWIHVEHAAFLFSTSETLLNFNDWAGSRSSERLALNIPTVVCACVDARSASRSRSRIEQDIETYAFLETSVQLRLIEVKYNFEEERRLQQNHLIISDSRTHRTPWLIHDELDRDSEQLMKLHTLRPPAMPFPPMPKPLVYSERRFQPDLWNGSPPYDESASIEHDTRREMNPGERSVQETQENPSTMPNWPPDLGSVRYQSRPPREEFTASNTKQRAYMSSSSAFAIPYFPLLGVDPSLEGVPSLPYSRGGKSPQVDGSDDDGLPQPEKGKKSQILIITLDKGVRALFTPEAVFHTIALVDALQAMDPDRMLDSIQSSAMSQVLANGRPRIPRLFELRFELPNAAFRLQDRHSSTRHDLASMIWYNVFSQNLLVSLCHRTSEVGDDHVDQSSVHLKVDEFDFNVLILNNGTIEQTVVKFGLDRITCWGSFGDRLWVSLHIDNIGISTLNRDTKLLAALINHAVSLSQSMAKRLEGNQRSLSRLRTSLLYYLATYSKMLHEAPFMTTTSFTLRTATFNPRNSDSWKLASRLRWVLQNLTIAERQRMLDCTDLDALDKLTDAKDLSLSAFQQWRGWDLEDPTASVLIQQIFGPSAHSAKGGFPHLSLPTHCMASIGQFSMTIDPGPKEDSMSFEFLTCVVSNLGASLPDGNQLEPNSVMTVAVFCKRSNISLRWEMVELMAGLSKEIEAPNKESGEGESTSVASSPKEALKECLHVTVAFEQFSTRIESINLEFATRCFGLTGSAMVGGSSSLPLHEALSLYSSHVISELSTQHTSILAYKLQRPSIHLSREVLATQGERTIIKAGGFCENLELHITQDLLGIIGVLDRVLSEEVHFIQMNRENSSQATSRNQVSVVDSIQALEIHGNLLLDSYNLSAKVLSTLQYSIQGMYARSSCRSLPESRTIILDFDVDSVNHTFTNYDNEKANQIASLSLPPLNGQVSVTQNVSSMTVNLAVALEQILLDASALHALFTTYSRREISTFRESVARDAKYLMANFENVMGGESLPESTSHSKTKSRTLLYRAHFAAAGLKIKAKTGRGSSYSARLTFELGHLNYRVRNVEEEKALDRPEMTAEFQSIKVFLKRFDGSRSYKCGDFMIAGSFLGTSKPNELSLTTRSYEVVTTELNINIFPETASTIVDIIGYLQQRFKSFNLSEELNTLTLRARRLRAKSRTIPLALGGDGLQDESSALAASLFSSMYSLEMNHIYVAWHVGADVALTSPTHDVEDLQFSIVRLHLSTRKSNSARLTIQDLQLQMAPRSLARNLRSKNSALLPEVAFNVAYLSTSEDRRLAFQAVGKTLDLRLTTQSPIPAVNLQKSIALATRDLRKVVADWNAAFIKEEEYNKNILGNKTLSSVLVAASFAGAAVHISDRGASDLLMKTSLNDTRTAQGYTKDINAKGMDLRAPGIAVKVEYRRPASEDPSLNSEIRIDASSNVLHPAVVPLFYEMSETIKRVMAERSKGTDDATATLEKQNGTDAFTSTDPVAILGSTRLNLGLRVLRQQFGLTCQPIARVAANAKFDDIYVTINTVQSQDQGRFFALSASVLNLQSSLQHVYSREPTASFSIQRIALSLMNSKHVSDVNGLSAILKISPMILNFNAKQMQDFFLFKEVWLPRDPGTPIAPSAPGSLPKATFGVRRYREVAATGAFPWNASVNIEKMEVQVDLGQSLGKSSFSIAGLWVSSKKSSDWEQSLCVGFHQIGINSTGRLSGFVELQRLRVQTSIHWPEDMHETDRTPLVEASTTVGQLQAKLAFEYQAFLVSDLSKLEFLMYNVRDPTHASGDRLVCLVEGDSMQTFCTTQTSAQCVSLYQAMQKLIQEKRASYEASLQEVEKFLQRKPGADSALLPAPLPVEPTEGGKDEHLIPLQLQTNVVVALKAIKVGAYPRTFFDAQIFKLEALDASTRFSVAFKDRQLQSGLGLSLGQVRIALSNLTERVERKTFEDVRVTDVVRYSTGSRGGTILKVPRLVAEMQTWQAASSFHIDYIFKSSFEGKIEVGWNYSRISYLRGMWGSHSLALAQRLGKPLTQSAVQITGGLEPSNGDGASGDREQEKITAVVNVPLSKYDYTALEPPIIDTPQLRDMGEATPPLEWIGLHRDRLPNLTHQIVIVPLLEVAKEVEDAYSTILGNS